MFRDNIRYNFILNYTFLSKDTLSIAPSNLILTYNLCKNLQFLTKYFIETKIQCKNEQRLNNEQLNECMYIYTIRLSFHKLLCNSRTMNQTLYRFSFQAHTCPKYRIILLQ